MREMQQDLFYQKNKKYSKIVQIYFKVYFFNTIFEYCQYILNSEDVHIQLAFQICENSWQSSSTNFHDYIQFFQNFFFKLSPQLIQKFQNILGGEKKRETNKNKERQTKGL
eukprot:TRINITY_DN2504_c0_g2_i1.p4 TRINITY_DN2504_c0_g2~~TRINITY_DN2504_c0_g2_i1.p4  ORF type:complete len:111 (+),score=0.97 TRINITY_DN2504_c0_g2_i1:251-583(+)